MRILLPLVLLISFFLQVKGQDTTLIHYIQLGLENNLALKQKTIDYRKSLEALNQARSHFLPVISLNARYSIARGGRIIEFPAGDMLNPVYNTLNALLGSNMFPNIENQTFNFYRPHEQETKLELIQPVFNPQIAYNYKIKKELSAGSKADMNTYKRQLVADIKTAYYSYLKTVQLNRLVQETRKLLEENIRVNNSLFNNDKVTIDVVYRSEAELSRLEQNQAKVTKNRKMAAAYFNFLLNRSFETPVLIEEASEVQFINTPITQSEDRALQNREELQILNHYHDAALYNLKLQKSGRLPGLFAAVDYGIQGTKYNFTKDDDFFLGSLVLRWDLFKGFENRSKISQSKIGLDQIKARQEELTDQIRLEVSNAWYDLEMAGKTIQAAKKEKESVEKAFAIVQKKYYQGVSSLIEFMDARTTMTTASANYIIAIFDYKIKKAAYERIIGTYLLPDS